MQVPEEKVHPRRFLVEIHALRFIGAAMVLFSHLKLEQMHKGHPITDLTRIPWQSGVDLFFIVSGFIMYYLGRDRFARPGAPREFIVHRIVRITPTYWITTTALLIIMVAQEHLVRRSGLNAGMIIGSYTFLPLPDTDGTFFPIFGGGWTLNFEMFFYAMFAIALHFGRRTGMAFLVLLFTALAAIGMATRIDAPILVFYTQPIILEFLYGMLLAHFFLRNVRFGMPVRLLLIAAGILLLSAAGHLGLKDDYTRPFWAGIPGLLIAAGFVLGKDMDKHSPLARLFIEGGGLSYALYLTHMFSVRSVSILWAKLHLPLGWAFILAAFPVAMIAAYAFYRFVEIPLLEYLRKRADAWLKRRPAVPRPA